MTMEERAGRQGDATVAPGAGGDGPAGQQPVARLTAAALDARVERLRRSLEECRAQVPAGLAMSATAGLDSVSERLALGVDHTVVAFFGGTGSGKSSLFNALTHLEFADVGARRPTTSQAAACTWGDDASALLTFLGVSPQRRIRRDTELDGSDEDDLAGLVLLDVPDYDSVTTAHALQVDRLVPLADVLVWVLDPQKYADAALHDGYLRNLGARAEDMLVLVNQVDTVPADALPHLLADVRALLEADGLGSVTVLPVSARRGDNLDQLRGILVERVSRESNAARTADAELNQITTRLLPAAAARPVDVPARVTGELGAALVTACGADVVAESIRASLDRAVPGSVARPEPPSAVAVEAARSTWMAEVTRTLPSVWRRAVDEAAAGADGLGSQCAEAVASVRLPAARSTSLALAWWGGLLVAVAGLVGLVAVGAWTGHWGQGVWCVPLVVAGEALTRLAGRARARRAEREAQRYAAQVRERVGGVVERSVTVPVRQVLERHDRLWQALQH